MKFRYKTNIACLVLIKSNKNGSKLWLWVQFFHHFLVNEELQNNELDPDVNYYLDEISSIDTKYYAHDEVKDQLKSLQLNSFSVLHLNIRSMKKHFQDFHNFIESLNSKFSAICLSETWLQAHAISDSNFQLPGY